MKRISITVLSIFMLSVLVACTMPNNEIDYDQHENYINVEGTKIKMITENTEVLITLNSSHAASSLLSMLPLEMTLIERNKFAKGMTLPKQLSSNEETTREYKIGDFGYWRFVPDLAIFYDDIYEKTIVDIVPLGHAGEGAENLKYESGTVRLELMNDEGEMTENE